MKKIIFVFAILPMFGITSCVQTKPSIEWISLPSGDFNMGTPNIEIARGSGENQHKVTLSAFRMSKYEVTFEQYDLFCEATNREKPSDEGWGRGKRPVINVNWDDATAFAEWMGCRLPTEAEWEYACRAGSEATYNTGDNLTTSQANFNCTFLPDNNTECEYREKSIPVGSFAPNAYGLFDMHGNVSEWCSDWYQDYSSLNQLNPKGPSFGSFKVFRGGSWDAPKICCRSAYRGNFSPDVRHIYVGFRLVSNQ